MLSAFEHLLVIRLLLDLAPGLESKLVARLSRMIHPVARAGFHEAIPTKRACYTCIMRNACQAGVQAGPSAGPSDLH